MLFNFFSSPSSEASLVRQMYTSDLCGARWKKVEDFSDAETEFSLIFLSALTGVNDLGVSQTKSPPLSLQAAESCRLLLEKRKAFFVHDKFFGSSRERENREKVFHLVALPPSWQCVYF